MYLCKFGTPKSTNVYKFSLICTWVSRYYLITFTALPHFCLEVFSEAIFKWPEAGSQRGLFLFSSAWAAQQGLFTRTVVLCRCDQQQKYIRLMRHDAKSPFLFADFMYVCMYVCMYIVRAVHKAEHIRHCYAGINVFRTGSACKLHLRNYKS
jgi:hypothetical protein